jgi:hypothetical protein
MADDAYSPSYYSSSYSSNNTANFRLKAMDSYNQDSQTRKRRLLSRVKRRISLHLCGRACAFPKTLCHSSAYWPSWAIINTKYRHLLVKSSKMLVILSSQAHIRFKMFRYAVHLGKSRPFAILPSSTTAALLPNLATEPTFFSNHYRQCA